MTTDEPTSWKIPADKNEKYNSIVNVEFVENGYVITCTKGVRNTIETYVASSTYELRDIIAKIESKYRGEVKE